MEEEFLMKITILTNEYPLHVYGGAGVHVEYLSRELGLLEEGCTASRFSVLAIKRSNPPTNA